MLLTVALLRSIPGIATRHRQIQGKAGHFRYEHFFAVVSDRGDVHILTGPNGTVRRLTAEDQAREDWEPFQEKPFNRPRSLKKPVAIPEIPNKTNPA